MIIKYILKQKLQKFYKRINEIKFIYLIIKIY